MRKPKQPGSAPHTHGWALGVQGQLMLFLCGITVLTLGILAGILGRFLRHRGILVKIVFHS